MALKEQLDKFKRQQEKCQSTLVGIVARAGSAKPSVSLAANSMAATPVKFSNDTKRLQQINSIRKAPVGAQIKRVISLLLETRQALTAEQINESCFVDINTNKAVFDSLRNNPKVYYDGKRFSYKAKHDVKDKNQLLSLIRKYLDGIAAVDLKDAYPTVMEDLQAMKDSGHIFLLPTHDSQEDNAYPNDMKCQIRVDNDLKRLFLDSELPSDMLDLEKELQKNGYKPATNTARKRAAANIQGISSRHKQKKKKRQDITKRTKLTNYHLPELLQRLSASGSNN